MPIKITFDPAKRDWTLRERGLDFEHAAEVFAGPTLDAQTTDMTTANFEWSRLGTWAAEWWSCAGHRAAMHGTSFR
jgi:uncharacterized DUF497 family protein